ncbi:phosphate acyltransferase PlsX [Sediminibacterium ginsengisoli]|uniref:Phosphate acyltransferase n=1 Tax=Sediminibacterium ginsengisoli TaxID=413434 RepID=A0A1T4LIL9_9BACT|nr:phosphate acyltransferase PlsX [Sediminibacterium ginsengisoli]SJZ54550.1 phosphate:acyl-[acyl carrier protein] acyltransferase [Sediminibacterium ginsengisoli]
MNIGLDMMGGDFAPLEAVKGLQLYLSGNAAGVNIYAIGDEALVKPLLEEHKVTSPSVHVIHAPEVIGYHEHPTKALKEKQRSSIAIGFHLLATGKIDAFISAGNTGAMLVGAMYSIKPIEGVMRPTISTVVPKLNGTTGLLLDVGLNADCKPEQLNQFALLGSLYAQHILRIANPKVGLMNVGEEEGKGNLLAQATYPLLKENSQLNFIGNIEGRDIFFDKADVMVCDGFTGNIILKLSESIYDLANARELGNDAYFNRFHYENYGGTPVLGVAKPVVIGHGISNAKAFGNMISLAAQMIESDLCGKMAEQFSN